VLTNPEVLSGFGASTGIAFLLLGQHLGLIFKLVKAAALVGLAIAALSLVDRDVAHGVSGWIDHLHPTNRYLHELVDRISAFEPSTMRWIGVGTLLYASLFVVEGVGLIRRKLWAEYVTIVVTASLIPIEIYEVIHAESLSKAAVLAVNIAIVIYLGYRLRSDGQWPFRRGARAGAT
jgi:uncharacterized membrane protein (DUF2068 family)